MDRRLLDVLRCPFCGARLVVEAHDGSSDPHELTTGILSCRCCAYPVVAGIPYMRTGGESTQALRMIENGDGEKALCTLLELPEAKQAEFQALRESGREFTFRRALTLLSPDAEGEYFLYRFSDPTFLVSDALVRALGQDRRCLEGYVLDLCGGTGHLTRSLAALHPAASPVLLADRSFWELWLAKQFVAPGCGPVCCDANEALPFAGHAFSLVLCSGAFEYVWSRRLLAGEMARLVGQRGVVAVTHAHNALCQNPSEGMPLDPAGYRALFEGAPVRLFPEGAVLDVVLAQEGLDLATHYSDEEVAAEPALIIVATHLDGIFRHYPPVQKAGGHTALAVNPLYAPDSDDRTLLRLRFPSDYYEAEYQDCKRYLPSTVVVTSELLSSLAAGTVSDAKALVERYVVLDLPERYL